MDIKEEFYETLFSYLFALEDLVELETKSKFETIFGKDVFDLIEEAEISSLGIEVYESDDEYTDEQTEKVIVALQLVAKKIQDKREEIEREEAKAAFAAKVASWSPEKQQGWQQYKAKIGK